jgi:molybdenum cofactor guanylyltransferase
LLQYLITRSRSSSATVTVARSYQGWQPLCAIYRRQFAEVADKALREGHYKIDVLFNQTAVEVISADDLEAAGFSERIFRNLNAPEDLIDADP